MPKQPSRPGIPIPSEDAETGTGRHRTCGVGRAAIARTEQLKQSLEDHAEEDAERIGALAQDVEQVRVKVDAVGDRVSDLRVEVATVSTALTSISASLAEQNATRQAQVIAELEAGKAKKIAAIEADKAEKIAAIEDESDRKKASRARWLKVFYAVVAACGAAIGALIRRFH